MSSFVAFFRVGPDMRLFVGCKSPPPYIKISALILDIPYITETATMVIVHIRRVGVF